MGLFKTYVVNASSIMRQQCFFKEFKIFSKRYYKSLQVKGLQSYGPLKFKDDPIVWDLNLGPPFTLCNGPSSRIVFSSPTLIGYNFAVHQASETCSKFKINWGATDLKLGFTVLASLPFWKDLRLLINIFLALST